MKNEIDSFKGLISDVIGQAQTQGATQVEVGGGVESGLSVTVRLGEVETVEFTRDKVLGVTVYFDQHKGSASTSDTTQESITKTVQAACDIAQYTAKDLYAGLADKALMAKDCMDLDLYHPWDLTAQGAIEVATQCEALGRDFDKRIVNSDGAQVATHQSMSVYGNSHGFLQGYISTSHSISCTLIGQQEGSGMQRDYWYTLVRDPSRLETVTQVATTAAKRTIDRLGARKIPTCTVPVLFSANVASGLIGSFVAAIQGSNLYRRASFLLDQLGEQVFAPHVTIIEDPHRLQGLGSASFDNEGVATQRRELVLDGVLQGYVLSSYSARRLGLQTTGNAGGIHNLLVTPGDQSFADLLKTMDRGLVVTELMGQGVNIVTGDYSRGACGFWVEHGEIQYPVEEITIANNLRDMFRNVVAVGNDVDYRGRIITGSLLLDHMIVAGG